MKDKHYLYRVAVTCYVDSLFYETGNADGMFAFFADIVTDLYSDLPKDELKSDPF